MAKSDPILVLGAFPDFETSRIWFRTLKISQNHLSFKTQCTPEISPIVILIFCTVAWKNETRRCLERTRPGAAWISTAGAASKRVSSSQDEFQLINPGSAVESGTIHVVLRGSGNKWVWGQLWGLPRLPGLGRRRIRGHSWNPKATFGRSFSLQSRGSTQSDIGGQ